MQNQKRPTKYRKVMQIQKIIPKSEKSYKYISDAKTENCCKLPISSSVMVLVKILSFLKTDCFDHLTDRLNDFFGGTYLVRFGLYSLLISIQR